jgi:hypothetical protein
MQTRPRMKTFAYVLLIAFAGCSRSSLTYQPDGGTRDGGVCSGAGCPACDSLDEASCSSVAGCRADYCQECACTATFVGCHDESSTPPTCPVFECPVLQCQCDGLDEAACIATSGCTPNYCAACGTSQFSGCTGPNEGAPSCPATPCATVCHGNGDCADGLCVAPGVSRCGGICPAGCTSDAECNAGQVCDYSCAACASAGKGCVAACTPTSCPAGERCGADGHCAAIACATSSDCPAYFDCVLPAGTGSAHCEQRACESDGDCGGGYCVDGGCYGALGTCEPPSA